MPRRSTFVSRLLGLIAGMAFVALSATEAAAGSTFVYALHYGHGTANRIHGFRLDLITGALTPLPGFPVMTGGTGTFLNSRSAIAHGNGRLYVVNNGDRTLSAFTVNRATGALAAMPFSPIALGAASSECLAVHPSGSPVVAGVGNGFFASFVVTATTASAAAGSPFVTADTPGPLGLGPPACHFSRDGNFLYAGGTGFGISGYSVTAGTGVLTKLPGSPFPSGNGNPDAYATDNRGRFFSMSGLGEVRAFTMADGALTGVAGNPFPFGPGPSNISHGVWHPGGFYMAVDRIGSRVGVLRINGTGAGTTLTAVPGSPFPTGGFAADDLALTPDGGLLVASHFGNSLTVFRVNASTGDLTPLVVQPSNTTGDATGFTFGVVLVPPPTLGDIDSDRHADVLWRNKQTGQNVGWLMNGTTVASAAFVPTIADTNWEITGTGDFNADGRADVVWRHTVTGQNIGWLMDGLTVSSSAFLPTVADTNWEIAAVGDFEGLPRGDVIVRHRVTGQNRMWLMHGASVTFTVTLPTIADTNWTVAGAGDVNGNGRADVIWRNTATGQNIVWLMQSSIVTAAAFLPTIADTNWEIKGVGDLDGDGKADVVLRNQGTGENIGWLMNGSAVASAAFLTTIADTNWDIKSVRDLNGDDKSDLVWRNKVSGQNIAWLMNGFTINAAAFLPTIADTNWEIAGQ